MPGLKTIYGRDGIPITDVRAAVVRSSLLNSVGEAIFYIATSSTKCKREVLEFGNFLLVQHDSLPDWVGIIDTPRPWHHGYVEVHAFEPEYILQYRPVPLNSTISGTPGDKFTQLLAIANGQEDTLIRTGDVFIGGVSSVETISDTVFSQIRTLQRASGHDWVCTPNVDALGKLTVKMDWLEKAGVETDLEFSQGHNILHGDAPLEESGEIVNSIEAVSDGEVSVSVIYNDSESVAKNGLRRIRKSYSGITEASALLAAAKQDVDDSKEADVSTPLTVVDVGQTFANIRIGNVAKYRYSNVGFDGDILGQSRSVRIEGWRFDESVGTCELFSGAV